ncbi:MAG TPA: hypothetical protein VFQ85_05540 [Mycobacteriales bacterium]|jgi:hypothetical protein|nr:hypothetical protein [Mycobacteriales bacterium]
MKLARLFAPLMVAVALAAPVTAPAATAAPTDSQMAYVGKVYAPAKAVLHRSQGLVLTNLDRATETTTTKTRTFTIKIKATGQQVASATLAFAESSQPLHPWSQINNTTEFVVDVEGQTLQASITVIAP